MLRLAFILHLFIGSTLSGVGIIAALVAGYGTLWPIVIGAVVGLVLSFPASWWIAKALYEAEGTAEAEEEDAGSDAQ